MGGRFHIPAGGATQSRGLNHRSGTVLIRKEENSQASGKGCIATVLQPGVPSSGSVLPAGDVSDACIDAFLMVFVVQLRIAGAFVSLIEEDSISVKHLLRYYHTLIDATEGHKSSIPPQDLHHYQQIPKQIYPIMDS
ncbi:hypothetical protein V2G26_013440 [Clonostachys chloroleuca]